ECETKELQVKQHANSEETKALVQIQTQLANYSLCKRHYNQLIVSDNLYQNLLNLNLTNYNVDSNFMEHSYVIEAKNNICEIGMQVNKQTSNIGMQVNKQTSSIGIQVFDNMLQSLEN
ncbi:10980_t:CDS:2, partial [Racocetra fulgida]